jgi:drug/metabolite transporter (DMT)-like permease
VNWTLLQHVSHGSGDPDESADAPDMLPAVMVGAVLSALVTWPLALPLQASTHDLWLLALLGVVQLAIPCLLAVRISQVLPGPEIALLALLEVIFGVAWAWLGADEVPAASAIVGGTLVLGALFTNEALALHERHARQAANPEAAV